MHHLLLAALLFGAQSQLGQPTENGRPIWVIGGTQSCASWLSTPANEEEGRWWLVGFWSGRNMQNGDNGRVGSSTDSEGIIGEVKRICAGEPSLQLITAAGRVYVEMERDQR